MLLLGLRFVNPVMVEYVLDQGCDPRHPIAEHKLQLNTLGFHRRENLFQ